MFIDKRATPPTETPTSAHRASWERERAWITGAFPHQQIWSAATVRPGHNSEGADFNQRHTSFPTSSRELAAKNAVRMKGKRSGLALWRKKRIRGTGAPQKEQIDLIAHTGDGVCSAGTVGIDWQIGGEKRGKRRQLIYDRGLQLNSLGGTLENRV